MKIKILLIIAAIAFAVNSASAQRGLFGAWKSVDGSHEYSLMAADNYIMLTQFDKQNKKFISAMGGKARLLGRRLTVTVEFNSNDKSQAGKTIEYLWDAKTATVSSNISGKLDNWRLADQGRGNLTGNWRFLQKKDGEKFSAIVPLQARRTYKLLTASRFQWAEVNIETGELFGTGGGSYTFKDGKYTENIDFFSRDNSRVGVSLVFNAELKDGNWHHSGKSSKGDPMYEVWGRVN